MQVTNVRYPKCRGKFSWLLESHPVVSYLCLYREHFSYTAYAYKHSAQGRDRNQKRRRSVRASAIIATPRFLLLSWIRGPQ